MFAMASSATLGKWDGDTTRYVNAMAVRPPNWRINAIDKVVKDLKSTGIWPKLTWLSLLAGHDEQATLLNVVNPMQTLTAVNNPAFIPNTGWQGVPANSAYLQGPVWNTLVSLNEGFMFGVVTGGTDAQNDSALLLGQSAGTSYNTLFPRSNNNGFLARINNNTTIGVASTGTILGHLLAVRDGSTVSFYKNGVLSATHTQAAVAVSAGFMRVFAHFGTLLSDFLCPAVAIGNQSLTAQQAEDLHNITEQYLADIARYTQLGDINASCVFDLDVTIADSYSGTGTVWNNICETPADGQTKADYNFARNNTDYYTFEGTANDPAAYWDLSSTSTSRRFQNTALPSGGAIAKITRSDVENKYTVVMALKNAPAIGTNLFYAYRNGDAALGFQHLNTRALSLRHTPASGGSLDAYNSQVFDSTKDIVVSASYDSDTGTRTLRVSQDGMTLKQSSVVPYRTSENELKTWALICLLNSTDVAVDYRLYAASFFNKVLSDKEFLEVVNEYERRHNRSYS